MRSLWPSRGKAKAPRTVYVGSHEDKLSRIPRMHVDPDDDQPTREDRQGHGSIFDIPVPLPRFLRGGRHNRRD
jgi:hypothetical protein